MIYALIIEKANQSSIKLPRQRILEFYVEYASIRSIQGNYVSMLLHYGLLHAIHSPIFQKSPKN